MKIKPKGRRIYRRKDRFEHLKRIRHSAGSVLVTFLLAGMVGFVGYSVGAPVLAFLQERHFLAPPSQYHNSIETETTEITASTESETIEVTETTQATVTTEVSVTEPTTQEKLGFVQKAPDMQGYELDVSALMTETALEQALEELPEGLSHILVPVKIKGGGIYYATSVREAARCNAVQAVLPLEKIYQMVKEKGYEPVAVINTLEDDIYAKNYPASSYHESDTGEVWEDKSFEQTKLWLSPESSLTQDYLSAIVKEIEDANFRILVCEGLCFPNFPRSDLENLEPICSDSERYQALTDLLTVMRASASETAFFVKINGDDALFGDLESMYAAEALPVDCLLVTMDAETSENVEQLLDLSTTVPVMIAWQGDDVPKKLKLKSYILEPENE